MGDRISVYHLPCSVRDGMESLRQGFIRLLETARPFGGIRSGALVAIKTHLGEAGNKGHVAPQFIAELGECIRRQDGKPFICETSTLYVGRRSHAVDHLMLAYEHGFTPEAIGMPIIMADGLRGHSQKAVKIAGIHHSTVHIAADVPVYDHLIAVNHVTGHLCSGMGACLKNLGMGLASRAGKLVQHSDVKPQIRTDKCTSCGACLPWCPESAIDLGDHGARINAELCIGCGECLSVCPAEAVSYNWNQESRILQEKMAEHAMATVKSVKAGCTGINFGLKITANCDCMAKDDPAVCEDIGILLSTDPVALDAATIDLLEEQHEGDVFRRMHPQLDARQQLRHAEAIGGGSMQYALVALPR